MADNPPINDQGVPLRVNDEMLILERKNVEILVKIPTHPDWGKRSATGKLYLTTCRLVFVNEKRAQSDFKAFDLPIFNLFGEKFEQPIFGSNFLSGKMKPLYNLIPGNAEFKLYFKSGGCDKFLRLFDAQLRELRNCRSRDQVRGMARRVQNGQFSQNAAYSDPTDPTVIFVSQPQNTEFIPEHNQNTYYFKPFGGQGYSLNQPQQQQQYQQQQQQQPQFIPNNPLADQQQHQQQYPQQQQQQQAPSYNYPPMPENMNQQYQQYPPQNQPQQQQQQQQQQFNPQQQNAMGGQQQFVPFEHEYPSISNQQQMNQHNIQQQQQQPQQQPDVGYYFGWFGPQLQTNQR